ncbi:HigA family addiction module antitoxin [Foetidibacter luteolus]|uniref:HigA family addiction module antitoxin n=1 Tax=Foetidibacter luteolus TaxID=2608880 RepID=UPI00129C04BC|nr:HigA family addiction module antitoxin [Foetidibacter luteolus]
MSKVANVVLDHDKKPIYSALAIHPGEVLKDEIEERGLGKSEAAKALDIHGSNLSEIFKGKRNITPALALKLEEVLKIPAEFWLNMQNLHDLTTLKNKRKEKLQVA